jgi:hypothetical protein
MYTFQLSDKELKQVSDSLDYFCKKYYGMNYNSKVIDSKINSYSVTITFTNYQVISDFLMEISDELKVKINLLNNKAIVDLRLRPEEERDFSMIGDFDGNDLIKIFILQGVKSLLQKGKVTSSQIMEMIQDTKKSLSESERVKIFGPSKRKDFDTAYLLGALENLHFKIGRDYFIGEEDAAINVGLYQGNLTISVPTGSKECKELEKIETLNRTDVNKTVSVFTYSMKSKQDLNAVITRVINSKIKPNVFIKP